MELREYYLILRRWLWLVVLCAALGAGAAYAVSTRTTPVYSASATLMINQAPSVRSSDYTDILTSERLARTYSEMIRGRPVLEQVIDRMGLAESPGSLAGRLNVEVVRDTQLIRLSVEHADPVLATHLANAVATAFVEQIDALQRERYADSMANLQAQIDEIAALIDETERQLDAQDAASSERTRLEDILAGYRNTYSTLVQNYEGMRVTAAQSTDNVIVFEQAERPRSPIRPQPMRNTALAGVVGAMIAVGTGFLIEYVDDRLRTPEEVAQATGLETVGVIRQGQDREELVVEERPLSPVAEGFRKLRTNLDFIAVDRPLRTLLVTSAGPGEGKSLLAANLAAVVAQAGRPVVLVETDMRQPRLTSLFGRSRSEGLTDSLLDGTLDGRVRPSRVRGLRFLTAGQEPPNPAELLASRRMGEVLERLLVDADLVVIDSAPILPVADTLGLAQQVDGVLLVIDAGSTRRGAAQQAAESLRQAGADVVGAVLNNVPRGAGRYNYGYHYDGYYNGRERNGRKGKKRRRERKRR